MRTLNLNSWSEFPKALAQVHSYFANARDSQRILFRGHSDSNWTIQTTLERRSSKTFRVLTYSTLALRYANELQAFTGRQWDALTFPQLKEWLLAHGNESHANLPCYGYMVYLRHHGFASPLLDWTESPYIAAYFAFVDPFVCSEKVAVFAYASAPDGVKSGIIGNPMIHVLGPFAATHKRHFSQQAWYSICTRWDESNFDHVICSHSEVFDQAAEDQDLLVKITVPRDQRREALKFLKEVNINHFTLFQTEDSLVKAMDMREFDL